MVSTIVVHSNPVRTYSEVGEMSGVGLHTVLGMQMARHVFLNTTVSLRCFIRLNFKVVLWPAIITDGRMFCSDIYATAVYNFLCQFL